MSVGSSIAKARGKVAFVVDDTPTFRASGVRVSTRALGDEGAFAHAAGSTLSKSSARSSPAFDVRMRDRIELGAHCTLAEQTQRER